MNDETIRLVRASEYGIHQVFHFLQDFPGRINLTGSRRFGINRPDSDFDFFTDGSNIEWLEINGFKKLEPGTILIDYGDTMITAVYEYENIHVQIVTDFDLREKLNCLWPYGIDIPKVFRKTFWCALIKAYELGLQNNV